MVAYSKGVRRIAKVSMRFKATKQSVKRSICALAAVFIAGCANNYQKFYVQRAPAQEIKNLELLKSSQEPSIFSTNNLDRDLNILRAKRYVVIGSSEFNAQLENTNNAIDVAKSVGATIVLLSSAYTNTQTSVVPFFMPNTTSSTTSGMISNPYGATSNFSGTTTTYGTAVVPVTVNNRRYDQVAVYLAKSQVKPKIGIFFNDLTDKERKAFGQNTGVMVVTVVENSPAFLANIINGDLIIKYNGTDVVNSDGLRKLIDTNNLGEKITFTVIRNGKIQDISLITSNTYN